MPVGPRNVVLVTRLIGVHDDSQARRPIPDTGSTASGLFTDCTHYPSGGLCPAQLCKRLFCCVPHPRTRVPCGRLDHCQCVRVANLAQGFNGAFHNERVSRFAHQTTERLDRHQFAPFTQNPRGAYGCGRFRVPQCCDQFFHIIRARLSGNDVVTAFWTNRCRFGYFRPTVCAIKPHDVSMSGTRLSWRRISRAADACVMDVYQH